MAKVKIPFFGLDRLYSNHKEELLDATNRVYSSGQVLDGDETKKFERAIAKYCNRKYAIAVNSCSQALLFATTMRNNQHGIAVPAYGFPATLNAVMFAEQGASNHISIVDTDDRGILDPSKLEYGTDDISTVLYVNLYGDVIDYDRLQTVNGFFARNDIFVIEDAAQSLGSTYKGIPSGKLGHISCLSFDPTKNLPNFGSGGMILTDDDHIHEYALDWRNNGKEHYYVNVGTNSRMSESDCAQMLVKLKYFDQWQQRRSEIAQYYTEQLIEYVRTPTDNVFGKHSWHKYVIHYPQRKALKKKLEQEGIETRIHYERIVPHYDFAVHFAVNNFIHNRWLVAESLAETCLSLPIYPELSDSEVERIVSSIKKAL